MNLQPDLDTIEAAAILKRIKKWSPVVSATSKVSYPCRTCGTPAVTDLQAGGEWACPKCLFATSDLVGRFDRKYVGHESESSHGD